MPTIRHERILLPPAPRLLTSHLKTRGQVWEEASHFTLANQRQYSFMPDDQNSRKVPQRTAALLDSLVRASASGPKEVQLSPYLTTPLICRSDVVPILPSSRTFIEFMLTQPLRGQAVLDFGSGSGILGVMAMKLGASRVDAIDVNPAAVTATRENADRSGFASGIRSFLSDGFSAVSDSYDLVLANLPMVDAEGSDGVLFGLFDPHFDLHRHFFSNLNKHLKPGGSAIICHSEFQEDWPFARLKSLIQASGLTAELVFNREIEGLDWQLYRITPETLTREHL